MACQPPHRFDNAESRVDYWRAEWCLGVGKRRVLGAVPDGAQRDCRGAEYPRVFSTHGCATVTVLELVGGAPAVGVEMHG